MTVSHAPSFVFSHAPSIITQTKTNSLSLSSSYLLGAILAYVPSGQAILKSVLTTARPPAGTMVFSALDKSNPAD